MKGLREKALGKPNGARLLKELDEKAEELAEEKKKEKEKTRREREALKTMTLEGGREKQKQWCRR